ncbi:hypothetical protein SSX86_016272 [Deinandra increscens subsp. villosa]|uniref:Uncharacterized protein n=1 Tax=Deinandra increscens subsp. villosa TaxID=3103831 RepID=A0AAP0GZV8_9ASTR
MKPYLITFILTLSFFTTLTTTTQRKLLHQPLFPVTSTPPPPPPPSSDNPFFHEHTPVPPQSPPPPVTAAEMGGNNTAATDQQPANNSGKKIAVGVSVGVAAVGMLSGLVFFIYKLKSKQQTESKEVSLPPSPFIYVGNVEGSRTAGTESTTSGTSNGSPYNKLNPVKLFDRYRPSPELQPLPPLIKPPAAVTDDEDQESHGFQTPRGSVISSEDGGSVQSLNAKRIRRSPIPRAKTTSPRSRLSVSSSPPIAVMKP